MEFMNMKILNYLSLVFVLALASACNGIGTADFKEAAVGTGNAIDHSIIFSGIDSTTDKTDSSVTLHWTPHPDAFAYDIFNTISGASVLMATITGQSQNQTTLRGLTPNQAYRFRVRIRTSLNRNDNNTMDSSVVMNALPDSPSGVALQAPTYSPSMSASPLVRVSGVKTGDTVKLYSDSSCNTEIPTNGDGKVQNGLTHIDLTATSLTPDSYTIYARAIGIASNASPCSSTSVAYVRNQCPANYIPVPHDVNVGTSVDFCVAKYEMKNVSGVATSQASGTPWVSITQVNSRSTCSALNALNGVVNKYALISNEEWMTIARNIEQVHENWSPIAGIQTAGLGVLARGHSDNSPANSLAASTDSDPYSGTGNSSADAANAGWEQKRTLTLSNDEVIWDLAGNVYEWVDWNVTPAKKAYRTAATAWSPTATWRQWNSVDTLIGENPDDEMPPEKWASLFVRDVNGSPVPSPLDGTSGIGAYYPGVNNDASGAARRGADWSAGADAGAFALSLVNSASSAGTRIGFRCVFRP